MTIDAIREVMGYFLEAYGLHLVPMIDYWQAMPAGTRLLGMEIEAPDLVKAANLVSLKDLANDWRAPVVVVASVDKNALARPGPVRLEDMFGPEVAHYTPDCVVVLNLDTIMAQSSGGEE